MKVKATKTCNAENLWTDAVHIKGSGSYLISGTFDATVTVQMSLDNSTFYTVKTHTVSTLQKIDLGDEQGAYFKVGIATGEFASGSAFVAIWR